jgi:hypothetical protein
MVKPTPRACAYSGSLHVSIVTLLARLSGHMFNRINAAAEYFAANFTI